MSAGIQTPQQSPIFYEILAYLADHPEAQDTLEGIVHWWLLAQRITRAKTQVKTALEQLIAKQFVIAHQRPSGQVIYRVNRTKLRSIRRLLAEEYTEKS